jgi:hypothetical protein
MPPGGDLTVALARHLIAAAEASDVDHVMWLNRNVTKHRVGVEHLAELLSSGAHPAADKDRVRR